MKIIIMLILMAISFLANSQSKTEVTNFSKSIVKTPSKGTKKTSSNTSVSIQNSGSSYSFKANFDSDKNEKVKKILMYNLDSKYLLSKGETLIWKKSDANEVVYNVTFKNGSLKMNVNKDLISGNASKKFETLGKELREKISNN